LINDNFLSSSCGPVFFLSVSNWYRNFKKSVQNPFSGFATVSSMNVSDFFSKYYVWGPLFLLFKLQRTFLFLKGTAKVRLFFTFPKFIFIYFFNACSTHFVDIFIYILQCLQHSQSL
jgi:hypothetical protein